MKRITTIAIICFCSIHAFALQGYVKVSGTLSILHANDSVKLEICKYGVRSFNTTLLNQTHTESVQNHGFSFQFKSDAAPQYFKLAFSLSGTLRLVNGSYFLENGDDIKIDEINSINYVHFSGRGSDKLNIIYQLSQIDQHNLRSNPMPEDTKDIVRYLANRDLSTIAQLQYLEENKNRISDVAYLMIKCNLIGLNMGKYSVIEYFNKNHQTKPILPRDYEAYRDKMVGQFNTLLLSNNAVLQYSQSLTHAVMSKFKLDSCIAVNKPFGLGSCYRYLKSNYTGALRERLVTSLIYDNRMASDIFESTKDALTYTQNVDFKPVLVKLYSQRRKGVKAYDFALADTSGIIHRLSQFRGKVVVMDLWFSGCGGCIASFPSFRQVEEKFSQNKSVVFISICEDVGRNSWIKSIKSGKYTSSLALNLYTMGKGDKHEIIKHYDIEGYPTFIVIDKNGLLMDNPANPSSDNGESLVTLIGEGVRN